MVSAAAAAGGTAAAVDGGPAAAAGRLRGLLVLDVGGALGTQLGPALLCREDTKPQKEERT